MEHWELQYLNYVEVAKPESLRNKIKENIEKGMNKYK
jgi:predicted DNA-binding transcriptional regulator YafY